MQGREEIKGWVQTALKELGGRARIVAICERVWQDHKDDIEAQRSLFFQWQYEIRWAGDLLRRDGVLRPAKLSPRGVWELS